MKVGQPLRAPPTPTHPTHPNRTMSKPSMTAREQRAQLQRMEESAPWPDGFLAVVSRLAREAGKRRRLPRDRRQDIAQDMVLFFLERIGEGWLTQAPADLEPLVMRMVRQRARLHVRSEAARMAREAKYASENPRDIQPWMNPDKAFRQRELDAARAGVLERLPEQPRRLYQLAREDDLGCSAAAEQLGITRKVARGQLAAVEKEFRQALEACDVDMPTWRSPGGRLRPRYRKRS